MAANEHLMIFETKLKDLRVITATRNALSKGNPAHISLESLVEQSTISLREYYLDHRDDIQISNADKTRLQLLHRLLYGSSEAQMNVMAIVGSGEQPGSRGDSKAADALAKGSELKEEAGMGVATLSIATDSAGSQSGLTTRLSRQFPSASPDRLLEFNELVIRQRKWKERLGIFEPTGVGENAPATLSMHVDIMIFQNKVRRGVPVTIICDVKEAPFTYENFFHKQGLGLRLYVEFITEPILYSKSKKHIQLEFVGGPINIRTKSDQEGEAILTMLNKFETIMLERGLERAMARKERRIRALPSTPKGPLPDVSSSYEMSLMTFDLLRKTGRKIPTISRRRRNGKSIYRRSKIGTSASKRDPETFSLCLTGN